MPQIDVILPTYNQTEFLDRAINSMLVQDFKDFFFIIVNDGSVDDTKIILNKYAETDQRIKVITNITNLGLPAALNIGHRIGQAPYCTWISTDNISHPNYLSVLLKLIVDNDYDFVQGRWTTFNEREIKINDIRNCKDNWGYGNLCPAFLYKRKVWETYPYDENMLCAEDLKFYLQAYLHPFKFGYTLENLIDYHFQSNSLTKRGNPKRGYQEMIDEIYNTIIKPKLGKEKK
jgi:glycosyltransferase involved in cell wall biosynthesis